MGGARAHVVVLPLPTRGHVIPMMHMAKLVAANGILVTFVNSEANDRLMRPTERMSLQRQGIQLESLPDGLPEHVDRTTQVLDLCESVLSAMPAPFDNLLARLQPPASCILADTWLTFAVTSAHKLGIPFANFWTQSAASFASLFMIANGLYTGQGEPRIPGAGFLCESDMNSFARCYDSSNFMFRFVTGGFDCLAKSRWIFINTFDDLERGSLEALRDYHRLHTLLSVGPLLPPSLVSSQASIHSTVGDTSTIWVQEESCLPRLDTFEHKSVVYVAFGSLALVSGKQIEEIALGLEASGYPFLWVTRPDLIYGESPQLNEDFLERVQNRAYFVSWAPQLKVLNHPSIGGFFTHGGWNSTLEAITAGVPMLGWPYFSDQPMDCTCIEEGWRVGLKLRDGMSDETLVVRDVVEAKVKALMSSISLQETAYNYSVLAKKAAQQGGSSFTNFQTFIDDLKSF